MSTHPRNYGGRARYINGNVVVLDRSPQPSAPTPLDMPTRLPWLVRLELELGEPLPSNDSDPANPLTRRVATLERQVRLLLKYVDSVDDKVTALEGVSGE